MSDLSIDGPRFVKHAKRLISILQSDSSKELFKGAETFAIVSGKATDDEAMYTKTASLHEWLFGVVMSDSVVVFCDKDIHFLLSSKKAVTILEAIASLCAGEGLKLHIHAMKKGSTETDAFDVVIAAITASKTGKVLGTLPKDPITHGALTTVWKDLAQKAGLEEVDAALGIGKVLSVKDNSEQQLIKTSAALSGHAMLYFQRQMEKIVEDETKVKHSTLSAKVQDNILNDFADYKIANIDGQLIDIAFSPVIMSGSTFDLKPSAQSDNETLQPSVIISSIGVRYANYCSNISRSFLINAPAEVAAQYKLLLHAFNEGLKHIAPKQRMSDVYAAVKKHIEEKDPSLVEYMMKSFGNGIGLEFRETYSQISPNSSRIIEAGMVFNFRVGLENVTNPGAKNKKFRKYSLLIADTVIVTSEGNTVLTEASDKSFRQVSYTFDDDGDAGEAKTAKVEPKADGPIGPRKARVAAELAAPGDDDPQRRDHQKRLEVELHRQAEMRLLGDGSGGRGDDDGSRSYNDFAAFTAVSQISKSIPTSKIHVDMDRQVVFFPINGTLVPFHIATIKNVTNPEEANQGTQASSFTLRINFVSPPASEPWAAEAMKNGKSFVKQLSYRSSSGANFQNVFRQIKELRKRYTQRLIEMKDQQDIIEQADLILSKGKTNARLRDVQMRPNMPGQRKTQGELQAHQNGFRFISGKGQHFDILYSNVKHAFFQPAKNDVVVLLHFNLKHPVLLGKKKIEDVQFFTEVMEASTDLNVSRGNDNYDEEHAEKQLKLRENKRYKEFCEQLTESSLLDFDSPAPDLGWAGVAGKTSSTIMPTAHCIVDLTEWPPTVITLSEIELIALERVDFSLKNFDMAIIFKDYKKPVQMITSIPRDKLDDIKQWLDAMNLKYYEQKVSLVWPSIMKHINGDLKGFFEDGGWKFLDQQGSDSEDDDDSDDSEEFNPGEKSAEDEDSESDSDYDEDDEDSGSDPASMSDEEEGKDWDELEKEAADDDDEFSSEEEEKPAKKKARKN